MTDPILQLTIRKMNTFRTQMFRVTVFAVTFFDLFDLFKLFNQFPSLFSYIRQVKYFTPSIHPSVWEAWYKRAKPLFQWTIVLPFLPHCFNDDLISLIVYISTINYNMVIEHNMLVNHIWIYFNGINNDNTYLLHWLSDPKCVLYCK